MPNAEAALSATCAGKTVLALHAITQTPAVSPMVELIGYEGEVTSLAFSPDGQMLASGSTDRTIRLWDVFDPSVAAPIRLFGHTNTIGMISFSRDGRSLASEGFWSDPTVRIRNLADPSAEPFVIRGSYPNDLAFSPDSEHFAVAGGDAKIRLWDMNEGLLDQERLWTTSN